MLYIWGIFKSGWGFSTSSLFSFTTISIDDIVATAEDSFYFTNVFKFNDVFELRTGLRIGNVGFYDGRRGHIVLAGLNFPNGINTSPDVKYVYVTEMVGTLLSVYIRESDNSLTLTQVVRLGTFVDNIDVDVVTGHLWVAGHPDLQLLLNHLKPPHTAISPSQVLRLTLSEDSKVTDIAGVYYNDGRHISTSSVAVHYGQYMLVGSVYTNMLLCQVHRG